MHNNYKLS